MNLTEKVRSTESKLQPFEVFFDGDCPLCRREIEMIRRHDKKSLLMLTDIADAGFKPDEYGKSLEVLMKAIHGRFTDGSWVTGVEVFREVYKRIGFATPVALSRLPILRQLLDLFYKSFAYLRYRAAVRRMNRKSKKLEECETELCQPPLGQNESKAAQ